MTEDEEVFLVHNIAEQLHEDVDVVREWPVEKFFSWVAYFTVKSREEKKAMDKARAESKAKRSRR